MGSITPSWGSFVLSRTLVDGSLGRTSRPGSGIRSAPSPGGGWFCAGTAARVKPERWLDGGHVPTIRPTGGVGNIVVYRPRQNGSNSDAEDTTWTGRSCS